MLKHLAAILILALAAACSSSRNLDQSFTDIGADGELKAVLFADRQHDYSDIDITVFEGRLLLTGSMRSEEGRRKLVENAWKARGVDQVIDEIVIGDKTSIGQGFADARIDAALRSKLIVNDDVKSGDYKIAVSDGAVFLLGAVRSERSLTQTLEIARAISGARRVVSHVIVRPL
ncbi:MAG: BON domain-containing protein [Parvularculaceae bacterium]